MSIFYSKKFLFFLSLLVLTLNFNNHFFSTLPVKRFIVNDFPSESHVYSRMLYNQTHSLQDRGGFMLRYKAFEDFDPSQGKPAFEGLSEKAKKADEKEFFDYESHLSIQDDIMTPLWLGLQKIRSYILEKAKDGSRWQERMTNDYAYYVFIISHFFVALFNALILSLFLQWVARTTTTPTAFITLGLIVVIVPALTYFGRSMWWMMGFWFIPFLVMAFTYYYNKGRPLRPALLMGAAVLAGIGLMLKGAMGYEYTMTIMVSAVIPTTFYAVLHHWKIRDWFKQCFIIGLLQIAAMALVVYLHYQAMLDYGMDARQVLLSRFQVRAYGGDVIGELGGLVGESVSAGILEVVAMNFFLPQIAGLPQFLITLPLLLWLWLNRQKILLKSAMTKALLVSIGLGAFGAVSMFIILKGHAYIHGYDVVAWSIPMNLLLCLFYAVIIKESFLRYILARKFNCP